MTKLTFAQDIHMIDMQPAVGTVALLQAKNTLQSFSSYMGYQFNWENTALARRRQEFDSPMLHFYKGVTIYEKFNFR